MKIMIKRMMMAMMRVVTIMTYMVKMMGTRVRKPYIDKNDGGEDD